MKKTTALLFIAALCVLGFTPPSDSSADRLMDAAQSLRYAPSARDVERLKAIVAESYGTAAQTPLFGGPSGNEATALLLYAVMYHESGLRPHIERCDCTKGDGDCDKGHAFGLPQIHAEWFKGHTKDEVCSSRPLQVDLAMSVLAGARKTCKGSPEHWLSGYHAGNDCTISAYGYNVSHVFTGLLTKAKIRLVQSGTEWKALPTD